MAPDDVALVQYPQKNTIEMDDTQLEEGMEGVAVAIEKGEPTDPPSSSGADDVSNVGAAGDTAAHDDVAPIQDAPKATVQMDDSQLAEDTEETPLAEERGEPSHTPLDASGDCTLNASSETTPAAIPVAAIKGLLISNIEEGVPFPENVVGAPLSGGEVGNTEHMPSSIVDGPQSVATEPAEAPKASVDLQEPQMPTSHSEETPPVQIAISAPLSEKIVPSAVQAVTPEEATEVQAPSMAKSPDVETPLVEDKAGPQCFKGEPLEGSLVSGALPTASNSEPAGSPRRPKALRPPPGFESLNKEGVAPTQGAVGSPRSTEDSDDSDREIRVEDLSITEMPWKAAKQRAQQQHQERPPPKMFEHLYWMMQHFTSQFARVHVERECDKDGVSVCITCRDAQNLLIEIQEFARNEPEGRKFILRNASFMSVLVELCRVGSPRSPTICTVTGPGIQKFVEGRGYCNGGSVATVMEGRLSDLLWERFLGEAAKKVKRVTYTIHLRPPAVPSDENSSEPALSDVPDAAKAEADVPCGPSSLDVAGCLDARHLWIYPDAGGRANIRDRGMAEARRAYLSRGTRRVLPFVGEIAGLPTSSEDCLERVLVLEDCGETAVVWFMDRGNFRKVRWSKLVPLGASFKNLPPAVCLAVLEGVKAMPFVGLLRECVNTLRALTNHFMGDMPFHLFLITKMTSHGVIPALIQLLYFPDYETRMASIRCLSQLCRRLNGRHAVSKAGCVMKVLDRLRKAVTGDPENGAVIPEREKQSLISLLQALFFRNWEHIHELANTDVVAVIYKVMETSPEGSVTHQLVQFCLRCVLDSGYKERRIQVRPQEYTLTPAEADDENYPFDESPGIQQHSAVNDTPQGTTGPPATAPSPAAQVGEASESPLFPTVTGGAAGVAPPPPPAIGRCYILNSVLPLRCCDTRELLAISNIKMASARVLATLACAFLNSGRPCAILYGISADGQVWGVALTRDECTSLRRGIDYMVGNLRPRPPEGSFAVDFVPVLRDASQLSHVVPTHYVVEVNLCGVPRMVYTTSDGDCFFRRGRETYRANSFEFRAWLVQQEEEYYLRLIAELRPKRGGDDDLLSASSQEGSV